MGKITPLIIGTDTGTTAKTKIDEAIESVEVSAEFTGDGNVGSELTLATNGIANSKLTQIATEIIKGRVTAGTGNVEDLTVSQVRTLLEVAYQSMTDLFQFGGQAHGGYYDKTFSATGTFDADDGNNQRMVCTGDSTINITNEEPGVFILDLPISGGGVSSLTLGASLGQAYPNNDSLAYTDGSINTITVFVNANGDNRYTITAYEA